MFEFGDDLPDGDFAIFPVDVNGCPDGYYYVDLGDGVWALRRYVPLSDGHETTRNPHYQGTIDAL